MELYKGYVQTKDKKSIDKFKKGSKLKTFEQVKDLPEYAGVLSDDTILIDIDDGDQAEILMDIIEDLQVDCKVIQTTRGKHFLFWNDGVDQCFTHTKLACGLTADIKIGVKNSYEVLKVDGQERFVEWDGEIGQLPKWLVPVKTKTDFVNMDEGQGRNSALFSYELTLQSAGLSPEEAKETISIINKYVLKEPLPDYELDTVTRDEAFAKPVFFNGKTFLHDVFGRFMKSHYHIIRINGQLHIYDGKIYVSGNKMIESKMVEVIPTLKSTQRNEVLKFIEIITPQDSYVSDANLIAFRNGVYDLETDTLKDFSPSYIITNIIPWDYRPDAYSEIADRTLNKIACNDPEIRALLEECIGYCFFRQNEISKSFFLTGAGSNGKSTFLDMVKHVLGRQNYVALDLDELSERFSTTTMFGKLANIGDDISDDFLQGKAIANFKKVVSGNDIKAENKGQDAYFFKPTVKLLFSANEIPRMRNKGFQAVLRRMVIIPFNAVFTINDPDFDARITWKLKKPEVAEYLIQIGITGLKRVLATQEFTHSTLVENQLDEFERDNNPILLFLDEIDDADIINQETKSVYTRYDTFCYENGFTKVAMQTFSKDMKRYMDLKIEDRKVGGRKCRIFVRKEDEE